MQYLIFLNFEVTIVCLSTHSMAFYYENERVLIDDYDALNT